MKYPDEVGLYEFTCAERDYDEYYVAITNSHGAWMVHDEYVAMDLMVYCDNLTNLYWEKVS